MIASGDGVCADAAKVKQRKTAGDDQ